MEQAKQKLSELIARINESFPDGNDLKGFSGISKPLITDILVECESMLVNLKEQDNKFETIILKRELAELSEKLRKALEEKFEKLNASQFNTILNLISRIRFTIRETYSILFITSPIRTELEITKAKGELDLLKSNIEDLKKISPEINELKESAKAVISSAQAVVTSLKDTTVKTINEFSAEIKTTNDEANVIQTDLELKQSNATKNEIRINEFVKIIEEHNTAIETIYENTTEWEEEIEKAKKEIASNTSEYTTLNTKSKTLLEEIEETHAKIFGKEDEDGNKINGYLQDTEELKNKIAAFLTDQQRKFQAQFSEIEGLLPGATSAGLAEAYQKQKDSYKKPIQLWSTIFILTITTMTVLSVILLINQFKTTVTTSQTLTDALISLLKDLPFFIPTIWLASYASKQQSQYKRLQQEYAFKETNAKSFHGHKIQIEELMKQGTTDKDLLMQLVAQLVYITSENPSQTLDNKSHEDSPPLFKLAEKYLPFYKKNGEPQKKEKTETGE